MAIRLSPFDLSLSKGERAQAYSVMRFVPKRHGFRIPHQLGEAVWDLMSLLRAICVPRGEMRFLSWGRSLWKTYRANSFMPAPNPPR